MTNISPHITYEEAIHSDTAISLGIKNIPDEDQLGNMKNVAENIFEPLRNAKGIPIGISSFFRSPELNKKMGGASTSQHMSLNGSAIDIDAHIYGGLTNKDIFQYIKSNLEFDQLIAEFPDETGEPEWVHVSYNKDKNRRDIMMSKKDGSKTIYEHIA